MRDILLCVKDILECIERIEEYVGDMDYEKFIQPSQTFDAIIRRLEIIGEASKYIPKDIREKYKEIPWKQIVGMRNRITHAYFGIDSKIVWKIIKEEFPQLKPKIKKIKEELEK